MSRKPRSAFRDRPDLPTIGDASIAGGDVDGPIGTSFSFDAAIQKCLSLVAKDGDESAARALQHVCNARKTWFETRGSGGLR